jgi:T-complex protein 1 subunit beta
VGDVIDVVCVCRGLSRILQHFSSFYYCVVFQVPSTAGKAALAMESFARALRQLPTIIADNGGFDSSELVTNLRAMHAAGDKNAGLNMKDGTVGDMWDLGVRESYKSKLQVLVSAAEAAEMILRVDDIIKCAPRQREQGNGYQ